MYLSKIEESLLIIIQLNQIIILWKLMCQIFFPYSKTYKILVTKPLVLDIML